MPLESKEWFDTKYYHILYKNRDYDEARHFIDNLTERLQILKGDKILDLACGKGRHSIYLNKLGYDVTGIDISKNSISGAKAFENDMLRFVRHDMRNVFDDVFDVVLNLFTSFGYFSDKDNISVLHTISNCLKDGGVGVLDYLNVHTAVERLVHEEIKIVEDITFNIRRNVRNGYIIKDIIFEDEGHRYSYQERVRMLYFEDFKKILSEAGLEIVDTYGDYSLNTYKMEDSDRLILIFRK